jgi:hypothetical protein
MSVDLHNAVLIFDEAHNIEDVARCARWGGLGRLDACVGLALAPGACPTSGGAATLWDPLARPSPTCRSPCREAGSADVDLDTLVTVQVALATAASISNHAEHYQPLHAACEALVGWLGGVANNAQLMRQQAFERFEVVWSSQQVGRGAAQAHQRAWRGWPPAAAVDDREALLPMLPAPASSFAGAALTPPPPPAPTLQLLEQLALAGLSPPAVEQLWQHYEAVRRAEGGDKVSFNTGAREGTRGCWAGCWAAGALPACCCSAARGGRSRAARSSRPQPAPAALADAAEGEAGLEAVPESVKRPGAGGLALGVMSRLLTVLRLLYRGDCRRVGDYRLVVQKWVQRQRQGGGRNFRWAGGCRPFEAGLLAASCLLPAAGCLLGVARRLG